jgi:hypothetical protein
LVTTLINAVTPAALTALPAICPPLVHSPKKPAKTAILSMQLPWPSRIKRSLPPPVRHFRPAGADFRP